MATMISVFANTGIADLYKDFGMHSLLNLE